MMRVWPLFLILCLVSAGCTVNEVIVAEESELVVSETPVEESRLLDVGIAEFASGLDEDNDPAKTGVYEEIRFAETKYLAYHLKTTLQGTGHWGAVRLIPSASRRLCRTNAGPPHPRPRRSVPRTHRLTFRSCR